MFRNGGSGDPMPAGTAIGIGLFLIATGILLIYVGRRAMAGRLRKNHFVGIRTTLTLNSEVAWDAAHRRRWRPAVTERVRAGGGRFAAVLSAEQRCGGDHGAERTRLDGGMGAGRRINRTAGG